MSKRIVNNALGNLKKTQSRNLSESFIADTDAFLEEPPDIKDFKSYREFYVRLAKCVLRAEMDTDFHFASKTANTLTYVGTAILMGLSNEAKNGMDDGLTNTYNAMIEKMQGINLTKEEASLIAKQQEMSMTIRVLEKIVMNHTKIVVDPPAETVDAEMLPEMSTPATRQIAALTKRATQEENRPDESDDAAF